MYSKLNPVFTFLSFVYITIGERVPSQPDSYEWHTQNYNSIHANKLVQSIAANDNNTITLAPFSCVRNKDSCNEHQCCFGQKACCKPTGVCGCRDPHDSTHSCPYDIATTSISSIASSSEKSVVTNACIQTISRNPKAASGAYNGGGGHGRANGARNINQQQRQQQTGNRQSRNIAPQKPVISYNVTADGDLSGYVRTAASGNTYVLTTTTTANFGPVKRFLQEFSAQELMAYLDDDVVEELLFINGCKRFQIFRK